MGEKPRDFVRDPCIDLSKNSRVFENDKIPASVGSTLSGPCIVPYAGKCNSMGHMGHGGLNPGS